MGKTMGNNCSKCENWSIANKMQSPSKHQGAHGVCALKAGVIKFWDPVGMGPPGPPKIIVIWGPRHVFGDPY